MASQIITPLAYQHLDQLIEQLSVLDAGLNSLHCSFDSISTDQHSWLLMHCGRLALEALEIARNAQNIALSEYRAAQGLAAAAA